MLVIRETFCDVCVPTEFVSASSDTPGETYVWQPAVSAPADLWLVDIDEDPGMAQWTSTSIASDRSRIDPSHRLFVYQLNCGIWSWLLVSISVTHSVID